MSTCEHPFGEEVGDGSGTVCAVCVILAQHSHHRRGDSDCNTCEMLKYANGESVRERIDFLTKTVWLMLEEAVTLSAATGQSIADVAITVREFLYRDIPILYDVEDPDGEEERQQALHRMPYSEYLQTPEWIARRRQAATLAGGCCATCNSDRNLETHHRTYERRGFEEPSDIITLCSACHTAVHLAIDARAGKQRSSSRRAKV